jgi:hypothetical protein
LNEIYGRKRDFRERGTIIYKDYWNMNSLQQNDSAQKIVLEDPDVLLDPKVQYAIDKFHKIALEN